MLKVEYYTYRVNPSLRSSPVRVDQPEPRGKQQREVVPVRMDMGLNLEQTQKLIMTPELRQAIKILQLSTIELNEYLEQEVLENPLLELGNDVELPGNGVEAESQLSQTEELPVPELDVDWQEYFQDESDLGFIPSPRSEEKNYSFEYFTSKEPTLHDHLRYQVQMAFPAGRQRDIGLFLIGNIDDHGYLQLSLQDAAQYLGLETWEVQQVLEVIQTFDPPGVGARTLEECLIIQLRQRDHYDPLVLEVIKHGLRDLAAGRLARIARRLNTTVQRIQEISDFIRTLNPKPGSSFGGTQGVRYIVPDVIIERVDEEYVVILNDSITPRLGINPLYRQLLCHDHMCDPETRKFLQNKLNAAARIIRSVEQRRTTLYRVVSCLVNFQREFLDKGIKYLKPLTLRQVAETLGIHESTVSRATANKYAQTPQGVFELKFFFASGVGGGPSADGLVASAESIKKIISEHINREHPGRPLTDQQLADLISSQGVAISRRTVAKYRNELGIPVAAKRRRY